MKKKSIKSRFHSYDVIVSKDIDILSNIRDILKSKKLCIVSDDNVFPLYGKHLEEKLLREGYEVSTFIFPNGEISKNMETIYKLLNFLSEKNLDRKSTLIALGGGVVGDITSFAASIYLRGIEYVSIPTTILSGVDSSIGGKTGVNLPKGKNLVGSFWPPKIVLCDVNYFSTLSKDTISDGFAEVIKYAYICDKEIYNLLLEDKPSMEEIIHRCISNKGDIVEADELEGNLRKILNFGHTVGHAIEKLSNYKISHGKAIAMGMKAINLAVEKNGMAKDELSESLENLLDKYNLNGDIPFRLSDISKEIQNDKKMDGDEIQFIIVREIGKGEIFSVPLVKALLFLEGEYGSKN